MRGLPAIAVTGHERNLVELARQATDATDPLTRRLAVNVLLASAIKSSRLADEWKCVAEQLREALPELPHNQDEET